MIIKDDTACNNDKAPQVNNLDLSRIPLPTWCRIHSTSSNSEVDYPEFKVAFNVFMQEMQNMEIVSNEEPDVSHLDT